MLSRSHLPLVGKAEALAQLKAGPGQRAAHLFVLAASDTERLKLAHMVAWFLIIAFLQLTLVPTFGIRGGGWGLLLRFDG